MYEKRISLFSKYSKCYGFTLLEVSIALLVIAALAVATSKSLLQKWQWSLADQFVVEKWAIADYAIKYRLNKSDWPGYDAAAAGLDKCDSAEAVKELYAEGYLMGMGVGLSGSVPTGVLSSVFDSAYSISCTADTFTITHTIPDSAGVDKVKVVNYIGSKIPLTQVEKTGASNTTATGKTITTVTSPSSMDIASMFFKSIYMGNEVNKKSYDQIQFNCPVGYTPKINLSLNAVSVKEKNNDIISTPISSASTCKNKRLSTPSGGSFSLDYQCENKTDSGIYKYATGYLNSSSANSGSFRVRIYYTDKFNSQDSSLLFTSSNMDNSSTGAPEKEWTKSEYARVNVDKWCIRN